MFRLTGVVLLISVMGCGNGVSDIEFLPPTTVQLPYKESFLKGEMLVIIEPIEDRNDAVKIFAYCHGCSKSEHKEWVQVGSGKVVVVADNGKTKCILSILSMSPSKNSVKEVKLSLRYWALMGPQ